MSDRPWEAVPRFDVLGVRVSAVDLPGTVRLLRDWRKQGHSGYVCVTGVHGVMESRGDPDLQRIHNESLLTVPDGMPLVWKARRSGLPGVGRVYGPDLMLELLASPDCSHFLVGSTDERLTRLGNAFARRFPGVRLAGKNALPRSADPHRLNLDAAEENALLTHVNAARPDFVWIGLSTPKQERFMAQYSARAGGMWIGVGAAFDVLAGLRPDAPRWVKRAGLQWLHRALQEPRRLGPRYARIVPAFAWALCRERLAQRKRQGGAGSP